MTCLDQTLSPPIEYISRGRKGQRGTTPGPFSLSIPVPVTNNSVIRPPALHTSLSSTICFSASLLRVTFSPLCLFWGRPDRLLSLALKMLMTLQSVHVLKRGSFPLETRICVSSKSLLAWLGFLTWICSGPVSLTCCTLVQQLFIHFLCRPCVCACDTCSSNIFNCVEQGTQSDGFSGFLLLSLARLLPPSFCGVWTPAFQTPHGSC